MAIRKEKLPLPISVAVTLAAYALLASVLLKERTTSAPSGFAAALLAFLPHAIAFVNALALVLLAVGWWLIRKGRVALHRIAMPSALGLISLFLVMYVTRIYLGGIKRFVGPEAVYLYLYLPVLFVHLALSILCIQPVLYVALIGFTRKTEEIPSTRHRLIGRIAVPMWIVSLALGLVVYLLLYHAY